MQVPGGLDDPWPVLEELAIGAPRLRSIFYKQGVAGGLVWRAAEPGPIRWSPRETDVVDPTGAGDAFAGGVLAAKLRGEGLEGQLECGLGSAELAIGGVGADGLLS